MLTEKLKHAPKECYFGSNSNEYYSLLVYRNFYPNTERSIYVQTVFSTLPKLFYKLMISLILKLNVTFS